MLGSKVLAYLVKAASVLLPEAEDRRPAWVLWVLCLFSIRPL